MNTKPCILILYTELAGYIQNCIDLLPAAGFEVHVVAWPVNAEAPFEFSQTQKKEVFYHAREKFSGKSLVEFALKLQPSVVLCSGWIDKSYLAVCAALRKSANCIMALDNKWEGTLKQRAISTAGRNIFRRCFSHCWVPGPEQYHYAQKLGFSDGSIIEGFYAADTSYFQSLYRKHLPEKTANFPRRYLYVGRYVEFKGIQDLWEAYSLRSNKTWELWCAGTGPLYETKPELPGIRHFGFVQPAQLDKFVKETSVFILPSHREPWGVALHEFAAAGFPLLCSTEVGAATLFLNEGVNGFSFRPHEPKDILRMMNKIENLSVQQLLQMGESSSQLAAQATPELWVQRLVSVYNQKV